MSIASLRSRRSQEAEKRWKSSPCRQMTGSSTASSGSQRRGKVGRLPRHSSEPVLRFIRKEETSDDAIDSSHIGYLRRFSTCIDLASPSQVFKPPFPHRPSEGERRRRGVYTEDSKVLVKVTVERSPGPVMALVKLGSTVEETISTIIDKYRKEGRRPALDHDDTGSFFQLYHSYFCFQALDKTDKLGDVGGRSFYLRRAKPSGTSTVTENGHHDDNEISNLATAIANPLHFSLTFVIGRLNKIGIRTRKLWKILDCISRG